jgi:hypothetical protein
LHSHAVLVRTCTAKTALHCTEQSETATPPRSPQRCLSLTAELEIGVDVWR